MPPALSEELLELRRRTPAERRAYMQGFAQAARMTREWVGRNQDNEKLRALADAMDFIVESFPG